LTSSNAPGMVGERRPRNLVFTDGPGPTAAQRRLAGEQAKRQREAKAAVVSSSAVVRTIVRGFSWLGVDIAAFFPQQFAQATAFAGCPPALLAEIDQGVRDAEAALGVTLNAAMPMHQTSGPSSSA
jgi:hypothetical protein